MVGGGAPAPVFARAGWNNAAPPAARRIISFPVPAQIHHNAIDMTPINDPDVPGNNVSRINLFTGKFRKIASTSVGRVLLYRILIEIRRHNPGGNVGCLENAIPPPAPGLDIRNRNRRIFVYAGAGSSYSESRRKIEIRQANGRHTIIGKTIAHNDVGHTIIGTSASSIDISLFHQLRPAKAGGLKFRLQSGN
jgi:hypothetical protein